MLLADRGYDADWIRAFATERGAWANVPPRSIRRELICFSPHLYRARNLVERFFNKIKQCRRVATRYDKLAANYLAFIQLASIRLWLRVYEFTALGMQSSPALNAQVDAKPPGIDSIYLPDRIRLLGDRLSVLIAATSSARYPFLPSHHVLQH